MILNREFLGTVATRGWRNFLAWGMSLVLLLLGLVFVYRFAVGTLTGTDFAALAGVIAPLMFQQWTRHVEVREGAANPSPPISPTGGLINNAAIA